MVMKASIASDVKELSVNRKEGLIRWRVVLVTAFLFTFYTFCATSRTIANTIDKEGSIVHDTRRELFLHESLDSLTLALFIRCRQQLHCV
jgi:hypothetical protein